MSDTQDPPRQRMQPPVDPRLLRYASASRGFFVAIGAIAVGQTIAIIAFAWLLTRAITGVVDGIPARDVTATLAWLAAVVAARAVLLWAREAVASRAAATVEAQLRGHLVDAVGQLGPEWLASRNSASLAVTAGHGLDALDAYFGRYLPQLVSTVVATPVILLVMWWQDWISGLVVLLTIPLIPVFMVLIGLATRTVQQRQWRTLNRLATRFADTVQGLSTLKVFGRQHRAASTIAEVTERYRVETMKVLRVSFLSGFALELLASISVAIIAVTIGFRLLDGTLALTVGLFVLLLAPEAYLPLRQVGVQFHAAAEGVAATDDVFGVLDTARRARPAVPVVERAKRDETPYPTATRPTTTPQEPPAAPLAPPVSATSTARIEEFVPAGALDVRDVRVQRGERMLPPVTFRAAPGTVTLVEGASGSGKSSLLAALRCAATYDGWITIGDRDVRECPPSTWLAWAGQQPGLLSGTVRENVALGDDAPDAELVARALDLACASEVDPDATLGVQGAGLSGGQAQRVAVARAFYRRLRGAASVIALDEPSSALDAVTEARLWHGVRRLADDGAAVVVVSHRTTAHTIADAVVRLDPAVVGRTE